MKEQMPTPLEESIHILNVLDKVIHEHQYALYRLIDFNVDVNVVMTLNHMTFQYTTIQVASYLDEYHSYFTPSLNEIQREYIKPFYKRIKQEIDKFPDIKKFRNHISAHNLRAKNTSVALYHNLDSYRVPQNIVELGFLTGCINMMTAVINNMFPGVDRKISHLVDLKYQSEKKVSSKEPMGKEAEALLIQLGSDLEKIRQSSW